jgi:hypothetical protein
MATVAVFGSAGAVGIEIARTLVLQPDITRLVLFDINEAKLMSEANDCAMLAEKMRAESVEVIPQLLDLTADGNVASAFQRFAPDVAVQAAIPISWYTLANSVPPDIWKRVNFEARLGPFLPLLLAFPVHFMKGWKDSGVASRVVQLSFPDVVNPVLAGMGLAPTCGSGNTENLCSTLRMVVADRYRVPTREVDIRLVAHHYHSWFMRSASPDSDLHERPFFLRAYVQQDDVTQELFADPAFIPTVRKRYPYQRPRFAATSVTKNVTRMLRRDKVMSHVSSPACRAGGMDARYGENGWEVVLPRGLSEQDCDALLAKARHADGIETIAADGTVTFTDKGHAAMKELLGYDCKVLKPSEIQEQAERLLQCIKGIRG